MRYISRVLLAATCIHAAASTPFALQQLVTTVHVDNYGATQNDPSDDDAPAVRAALNFAEALTGDVKLVFGPGPYHFRSVVGANQWFLDSVGGYVPDSLTFDGTATEIILVDEDNNGTLPWFRKGLLLASGCSNLTIQDMTIDYRLDDTVTPIEIEIPSSGTQGTIVRINPNYLDVLIDEGYRSPFALDYSVQYPNLKYAQSRLFTPSGDLRANVDNRIYTKIDSLGGRYYRLNHGSITDDVQIGDRIALPNPQNAVPVFRLNLVTNLHIDNVTVHTAPGFGVLAQSCDGVEIENVAIVPGPTPSGATEPRIFSINRDAIHVASPRGDVEVNACEVRNNGDDAITVHGKTFDVDSLLPASVVRLHSAGSGTFNEPRVGDTLRLFDSASNTSPESVLLSVSPVTGSPSYYDVTFLSALPLALDDELQNLAGSGDSIVITGNTCERINGRGVMVKSGNVTISGNTTRYTYGPGVSVLSVLDDKQEGGFATNVDIDGNTIEHPHMREGGKDFFRGGISLHHRAGPHTYEAEDIFVDIAIRNNVVRNAHGPSIIVSNASTLAVYNNVLDYADMEDGGSVEANGIDITAVVTLDWVDGITFENNTLTHFLGGGPSIVSWDPADVNAATIWPPNPDNGFTIQ